MGLAISKGHLQVLVRSRDGYPFIVSGIIGYQIRDGLVPGTVQGNLPVVLRDTDLLV